MRATQQTRELLALNLDKLNLDRRTREIMEFRWGLTIRTLEETGQKFDITRERVRQIEEKVFSLLTPNV